jgi:hypothetical protein
MMSITRLCQIVTFIITCYFYVNAIYMAKNYNINREYTLPAVINSIRNMSLYDYDTGDYHAVQIPNTESYVVKFKVMPKQGSSGINNPPTIYRFTSKTDEDDDTQQYGYQISISDEMKIRPSTSCDVEIAENVNMLWTSCPESQAIPGKLFFVNNLECMTIQVGTEFYSVGNPFQKNKFTVKTHPPPTRADDFMYYTLTDDVNNVIRIVTKHLIHTSHDQLLASAKVLLISTLAFLLLHFYSCISSICP